MHLLVMLVSMGSASTGDIVLHGPGLYAVGLVCGTTIAKVCVDIHGFWYHQMQCWFQGSGTPSVAMFISTSLTAMGIMSTQVAYAAKWARPRLLPQAMPEFVDKHQPGSGLISMAHITTGAAISMHVEIWGLCWTSPVPHWLWNIWPCPSLDTAGGELSLPSHRRGGPTPVIGVAELAPMAKV